MGWWGWLAACYAPPALPEFDGVPVVPRPYEPCAPDDEDVRVSCVIDGDTLDLGGCREGGTRVRLLGVDAPETDKPDVPAECFAEEAERFLRDLVEFADVTVSYDQRCDDVFGRTLGYLWLRGSALERARADRSLERYVGEYYAEPGEPGLLVNEALLGLGFARGVPEFVSGPLGFSDRFDAALDHARATRAGLWAACDGAAVP